MYQRWRHLSFLHWEVEAEALARLLPAGLTLDTWEGRAYVGLVPFTMRGVRPVWLPPFPPVSNFHETNVRTYVHHEGREPGVWFFSLEAASSVAVRLARAWYKLPYFRATMELKQEGEAWVYHSERRWPQPVPARCAVRCVPRGPAAASEPGTLQHFLVERYNLYTVAEGGLYRGRVHHPPYAVQAAEVEAVDESLLAAAGIRRPAGLPSLAHFSAGVDVDVFGLERVTA